MNRFTYGLIRAEHHAIAVVTTSMFFTSGTVTTLTDEKRSKLAGTSATP